MKNQFPNMDDGLFSNVVFNPFNGFTRYRGFSGVNDFNGFNEFNGIIRDNSNHQLNSFDNGLLNE